MAAVDLRTLYAVPPGEFVAARAALVASLKAERRKEEAEAVRRLRRPRLAEHALNTVARERAEVVAEWVAAVAALDAAQACAIGGGGGELLRDASASLRVAHAAVLDAAVAALGGSGSAQRADITETLRALAHPHGAPLLATGVVGSDQLGDLVMFAGAPDPVVRERARPHVAPERPAASSRRGSPGSPPPAERQPAPAMAKVDLRRLRAAERLDRDARKELEQAEQALAAARQAVAAAKLAVAAATNRAAAARADARSAAASVVELRGGACPA